MTLFTGIDPQGQPAIIGAGADPQYFGFGTLPYSAFMLTWGLFIVHTTCIHVCQNVNREHGYSVEKSFEPQCFANTGHVQTPVHTTRVYGP